MGAARASERPGLAEEALLGGRVYLIGAQQLDGDLAIEGFVVGGVDHSGGAGALQAQDDEPADPDRLGVVGEQLRTDQRLDDAPLDPRQHPGRGPERVVR